MGALSKASSGVRNTHFVSGYPAKEKTLIAALFTSPGWQGQTGVPLGEVELQQPEHLLPTPLSALVVEVNGPSPRGSPGAIGFHARNRSLAKSHLSSRFPLPPGQFLRACPAVSEYRTCHPTGHVQIARERLHQDGAPSCRRNLGIRASSFGKSDATV